MDYPIIPLPLKYDALTEVDNVAWNGFPDRLMHHPFVYVATDSKAKELGLVVLAKHGLGAFYKLTADELQADPASVAYGKIIAVKDPGCMVQVHRDLPGTPAMVEVKVETTDVVVKTVLADDVSHPIAQPPRGEPTPLIHLEPVETKTVVIHCMMYLQGTECSIDLSALATATFKRIDDEWVLEVPMKQDPNFREVFQ